MKYQVSFVSNGEIKKIVIEAKDMAQVIQVLMVMFSKDKQPAIVDVSK